MTPGPGDREELRAHQREALARLDAAMPVIEVTGVVTRLDIEGGVWVLDADDGRRLELLGVLTGQRPGEAVLVTGRLRPDLATIAAVGPVLEVVAVHR